MLQLNDISLQFAGDLLYKHVDLLFQPDHCYGIIGANGAGKSTLLKALLGEREFDGNILFSVPGSRRTKARIGYVPQSPNFDPGDPLSVADLFTCCLSRRPAFLGPSKSDRELILECLDRVHGEDLIDKRVGTLSGGELQRVLLALALLGAALLTALGVDPIAYYSRMFTMGMVGNKIAYKTFENYLNVFVPLALTSVALSLAFKMRFWNIGGEGQFILGAIASATAPAATLMVVRQYKADGPLTRLLMLVVAIDDAVGLLLFSVSFGIAPALSNGQVSVLAVVVEPILEILLSLGLGAAMGWLLNWVEQFFHSRSKRMTISVAFVLLTVGLSTLHFELGCVHFGFSLLLVCMMTGTVFCNICPTSEELMERIEGWTMPLNILFFVLSGAELDLEVLANPVTILVGVIYIIARSAGKYYGAAVSCCLTKQSKPITDNLGIPLLPQAGVAPTPVTALLHAVAVVNAGAFAIIRLTYYSFGTEFLRGTWVQNVCLALAMFTIVYGCSRAVKESHIKRRLAWSTVSNLSYIVFGAVIMTPQGLVGALAHFVFHGFMKITSFLCAGAFMHQTGKKYVYEMDGLGKTMKIVFGTFTGSALGLMGVPGFAGFISKWNLTAAAV